MSNFAVGNTCRGIAVTALTGMFWKGAAVLVLILGEGDGRLVAVYHMLVEERAVLDEVARVAVHFGPLADNGRRRVVELARQAVRLEEAAEVVPEFLIVVAQCRRELVGCAIPCPQAS